MSAIPLEQRILRVLSEKQYHAELASTVKPDMFSSDVYSCIQLFGRYFKANASANRIELESFTTWMNLRLAKATTEEITRFAMQQILLKQVFSLQISEDLLEEARSMLCELTLADLTSKAVIDWEEGNLDCTLGEHLDTTLSKYLDMTNKTHLQPIRKDIGTILNEQDDEHGLTLPLEGLNRVIAPQKAGDFLVIGAQNNIGKTALAVQVTTHYAKQLPKESTILYLNNEGIGDHIILRTRQVALELGKYDLEDKFKAGENIEEQYREAINGDSFKIEVIDVHGINVGQVQGLLRRYKPDVVVYDMLDAIHGFGGGGMDVDRYKQLYSWARAQCANPNYRHIGVALTQVSHDGEGCIYPPKHALEGSKVAKQSQADVLIMVGADEAKYPNTRFFHVPRCKRTRRGATESKSQSQCFFNPEVGMYKDG